MVYGEVKWHVLIVKNKNKYICWEVWDRRLNTEILPVVIFLVAFYLFILIN